MLLCGGWMSTPSLLRAYRVAVDSVRLAWRAVTTARVYIAWDIYLIRDTTFMIAAIWLDNLWYMCMCSLKLLIAKKMLKWTRETIRSTLRSINKYILLLQYNGESSMFAKYGTLLLTKAGKIDIYLRATFVKSGWKCTFFEFDTNLRKK